MNDDAFDNLPRTADGLPIIVLMGDPDMGGGEGFLSLVDKGANGRKVKVLKHADLPAGSPLAAAVQKAAGLQLGEGEHEVVLDLGQQNGEAKTWFQTLFGPFLAMGGEDTSATERVQKDAITFDEAIVIPLIFDRLWDGWDALHDSIHSIMRDDTIGDKKVAVEMALSAFSGFIMRAFEQVPVLKREQAAAVKAAAIEYGTARKNDPSLQVNPAPDLATITAAQATLQELGAALTSLAAKAAPTAHEDDTMLNVKQIAELAGIAAEQARKAAKAVNPQITNDQYAAVGEAARQQVMKAAVGGAPQPGIPTTTLQDQLNEGMGMNGSPKDPNAAFTQAINGMMMITRKVAQELGIDPDTGEDVTLLEDGSNAGLAHVVKRQGEAIANIAAHLRGEAPAVQPVLAQKNTPAPSQQPGEQPEAPVVVKKSGKEIFKGHHAWDFTIPARS